MQPIRLVNIAGSALALILDFVTVGESGDAPTDRNKVQILILMREG
jgi:hypothetical protein